MLTLTHLRHSDHPDFLVLISALDNLLKDINGPDHPRYHQLNQLPESLDILVAYENGSPVGCLAMKLIDAQTGELKRMFVVPASRKQGVAGQLLQAMEEIAKEQGLTQLRLETTPQLAEAVRLYQRHGFRSITNYGEYIGQSHSCCFGKNMTLQSQTNDREENDTEPE